MTIIEVHFKEEEPYYEPEPLGLEHFYFPLVMLLVGLLLSLFCLLAEIIIHRIMKSKTDVPKETFY